MNHKMSNSDLSVCPECEGKGKQLIECDECFGHGHIECETCEGAGCNACEGFGYFDCEVCQEDGEYWVYCDFCNGEGTLEAYEEQESIARQNYLIESRYGLKAYQVYSIRDYWLGRTTYIGY